MTITGTKNRFISRLTNSPNEDWPVSINHRRFPTLCTESSSAVNTRVPQHRAFDTMLLPRALKGDPRYHEICPALIVLSSSPLAGEATTVLNVHPLTKEVLKVSSRDLNTHLLRLYLSDGEGAFDSLYRDCLVLPVAKMRRSIGDEELRELISKAPQKFERVFHVPCDTFGGNVMYLP